MQQFKQTCSDKPLLENNLNELVKEEVFTLNKDFDMHNGYHILIYERVKPVTEEEKEKYLETLKEESKTYKDLYEKIIKDYK